MPLPNFDSFTLLLLILLIPTLWCLLLDLFSVALICSWQHSSFERRRIF